MTRDNSDRLGMFALQTVKVVRLALNMDQVRQYNPPPNPAKETDVRSTGYIAQYGRQSWELDALEPTVIGNLIRSNVGALIDRRKWLAAQDKEKVNKADLQLVSNKWVDIVDSFR